MPNGKKARKIISSYFLWVLGFWCKAPAPFKWLLLCRILLNRPRCGTGKADTRDRHWGKTPWSPTGWDTVAAQIVTVMQKNRKHPYNATNNRQKKRLISSAGKHSQQSKQNCIDQLHRGLGTSLYLFCPLWDWHTQTLEGRRVGAMSSPGRKAGCFLTPAEHTGL